MFSGGLGARRREHEEFSSKKISVLQKIYAERRDYFFINYMINIQENISLKDYTTFKIGGLARYFTTVKNLAELKEAVTFSKSKGLPFFVLGGAANILVSDEGFPGLVIKMEIKGMARVAMSLDSTLVILGAGEDWDEAVAYTVEKKLYGLENLSGIPGTVGASPVQNIGAYGQEVKNVMCSLKALNTDTGEVEIFNNDDCYFSYRDSIFKRPENKKYIITEVSFLLKTKSETNIGYKDLQLYFLAKGQAKPGLKEVREAVLQIRAGKFPDLKTTGLAGSFFKNLIVSQTEYAGLKEKYPLVPGFAEDDDKVKVPLAWILDNVCGLKGYREGNVGLYEKQPIILVNFGGADEKEVSKFAEKISDIVKQKINLNIEWEVEKIH